MWIVVICRRAPNTPFVSRTHRRYAPAPLIELAPGQTRGLHDVNVLSGGDPGGGRWFQVCGGSGPGQVRRELMHGAW